MPELPEVETVSKTLKNLVQEKQIEKVEVNFSNMIKHPEELEVFKDALVDETIEDVSRRGKFILIYTTNYTLVSHLRMEGKYGLYEAEEPIDKHTHVIFHLKGQTQLRYKDVRKFGTMHLFKRGEEFSHPPLSKLGPEPFSEEFTVELMKDKLSKTTRFIKTVLLDQHFFVGLGNIYVDEALFRSGIHPKRPSNELTAEEIKILHQEIIATLKEAVDAGGSTIRSYVNSQGEIGMFQLQIQVYGRANEPCNKCQTILERTKTNGRGTVYCPNCQK